MEKSFDEKTNVEQVGQTAKVEKTEKRVKEPRKKEPKEGFFKRHGLVRLEYDHASRFYPILNSKKSQSNFCVGAVLDEPIDATLLEQAVNDCATRYPAFKVRQKRGYAWHYLIENNNHIKVFPLEKHVPCPLNRKELKGYMFKLTCGENRIEMIIFHGLCDGNGAIEFLKTIILAYRRLQGRVITDTTGILDHEDDFDPFELEDSFVSHYAPIKLGDVDLKKLLGGTPVRIKGTPAKDGFETDRLVVDSSGLLSRAKAVGVSFTSYVVGVIAYAMDKAVEGKDKHNYVIMVPVNLRNLFESVSLRNFVTFVRVIIKPHTFETVDEYAVEAQKQIIEESSKEKMEQFICTSVKAQKNFFLRITPLFLKQIFVKLGRLFASSRQTIIFSNIGRVQVPKELGVEYFYMNMNASKANTQNMSAATTDGKSVFTLTRAIKEKDLSNTLFALLKGEETK